MAKIICKDCKGELRCSNDVRAQTGKPTGLRGGFEVGKARTMTKSSRSHMVKTEEIEHGH